MADQAEGSEDKQEEGRTQIRRQEEQDGGKGKKRKKRRNREISDTVRAGWKERQGRRGGWETGNMWRKDK